jgi:hypothetical protein
MQPQPEPESYDDSDDDYYDDDPNCTWCGGEPWAQECSNPLECWCGGNKGHCSACNDTGLAKYQTIW